MPCLRSFALLSLLLLLSHNAHALKNITFGASYSLKINNVRAGFYTEWVAGINYVVEGLNKVGPFVLSDGESYQYAFKGLEDYGNLTLSTLNHEALANDSTVNCLLANIGVPTSFIGKYAAQRNNKLVMGTTVGDLDWPTGAIGQAFSSALTAFREPTLIMSVPVDIICTGFRLQRRFSVVVSSSSAFMSLIFTNLSVAGPVQIGIFFFTCDATTKLAKDKHDSVSRFISLPEDVVVPDHQVGVTNTTVLEIAIDRVVASQSDVVFMCSFIFNQEYIMRGLRARNYSPKAVFSSSFYANFADTSLMEFVGTFGTYNPLATYPPDDRFGPYFRDVKSFDATFRRVTGRVPSDFSVLAVLAGLHYHMGVMSANSVDDALVRRAIFSGRQDSFLGSFSYDGAGLQQKESLFMQVIGGVTRVVGPIVAQEADFQFPFPTWEERIYKVTFGDADEIVIIVLALAFSAFSVGNIVWVCLNWHAKAVRASSPAFMVTFLAGSLLLYSSIYTFMPNVTTTPSCILRVWVLTTGFVLFFGSLIAKTWRIDRLYSPDARKIISISDFRIAQLVIIMFLIQAVISILGSTITDLRAEIVVVDPYRLSQNYPACFSNATPATVLLIIECIYVLIMLVAGGAVAWRVRRIPYNLYDESKVIGFAIYNVGFFTIVAVVLEFALSGVSAVNVRHIVFIVRSACTLLGTGISVATMMISKWIMHKKIKASNTTSFPYGDSSNKTTSVYSGSAGTLSTLSYSGGEVQRIVLRETQNKLKAAYRRNDKLEDLLVQHGIEVPNDDSSELSTPSFGEKNASAKRLENQRENGAKNVEESEPAAALQEIWSSIESRESSSDEGGDTVHVNVTAVNGANSPAEKGAEESSS